MASTADYVGDLPPLHPADINGSSSLSDLKPYASSTFHWGIFFTVLYSELLLLLSFPFLWASHGWIYCRNRGFAPIPTHPFFPFVLFLTIVMLTVNLSPWLLALEGYSYFEILVLTNALHVIRSLTIALKHANMAKPLQDAYGYNHGGGALVTEILDLGTMSRYQVISSWLVPSPDDFLLQLKIAESCLGIDLSTHKIPCLGSRDPSENLPVAIHLPQYEEDRLPASWLNEKDLDVRRVEGEWVEAKKALRRKCKTSGRVAQRRLKREKTGAVLSTPAIIRDDTKTNDATAEMVIMNPTSSGSNSPAVGLRANLSRPPPLSLGGDVTEGTIAAIAGNLSDEPKEPSHGEPCANGGVSARQLCLQLLLDSRNRNNQSKISKWVAVGSIVHALIPFVGRVIDGGHFFGANRTENYVVGIAMILQSTFHGWVSSLFLSVAVLDFQRRRFILKSLGNLISAEGYHTSHSAHALKINTRCPQSLTAWVRMREALVQTGSEFLKRIQVYTGFFLVWVLLLWAYYVYLVYIEGDTLPFFEVIVIATDSAFFMFTLAVMVVIATTANKTFIHHASHLRAARIAVATSLFNIPGTNTASENEDMKEIIRNFGASTARSTNNDGSPVITSFGYFASPGGHTMNNTHRMLRSPVAGAPGSVPFPAGISPMASGLPGSVYGRGRNSPHPSVKRAVSSFTTPGPNAATKDLPDLPTPLSSLETDVLVDVEAALARVTPNATDDDSGAASGMSGSFGGSPSATASGTLSHSHSRTTSSQGPTPDTSTTANYTFSYGGGQRSHSLPMGALPRGGSAFSTPPVHHPSESQDPLSPTFTELLTPTSDRAVSIPSSVDAASAPGVSERTSAASSVNGPSSLKQSSSSPGLATKRFSTPTIIRVGSGVQATTAPTRTLANVFNAVVPGSSSMASPNVEPVGQRRRKKRNFMGDDAAAEMALDKAEKNGSQLSPEEIERIRITALEYALWCLDAGVQAGEVHLRIHYLSILGMRAGNTLLRVLLTMSVTFVSLLLSS